MGLRGNRSEDGGSLNGGGYMMDEEHEASDADQRQQDGKCHCDGWDIAMLLASSHSGQNDEAIGEDSDEHSKDDLVSSVTHEVSEHAR